MKKSRRRKLVESTGLLLVDGLGKLTAPAVDDYLKAASEYVRESRRSTASQKKAAQIRLSASLARALVGELKARLPGFRGIATEHRVAGGLRDVKADVSEFHKTDGLRFAVELKPVNLAVGRAIWNRFGDIRTFAVNLHLKFPFAVVGGVLVVPTFEEQLSKEAEEQLEDEDIEKLQLGGGGLPPPFGTGERKDTTHLIARAVDRLARAGGRLKESDAPHLLEGICVLVYDPETGIIHPTIPPTGKGLRWEEFVAGMVTSYIARFGEIPKA